MGFVGGVTAANRSANPAPSIDAKGEVKLVIVDERSPTEETLCVIVKVCFPPETSLVQSSPLGTGQVNLNHSGFGRCSFDKRTSGATFLNEFQDLGKLCRIVSTGKLCQYISSFF